MRTGRWILLLTLPLLLPACGEGDDALVEGEGEGEGGKADGAEGEGEGCTPDGDPGCPGPDWDREILATRLAIDVAARTGRATVTLAPTGGQATASASFEAAGLAIQAVRDEAGEDLPHVVADGSLHVDLTAQQSGPEPVPPVVVVDYAYALQDDAGALASGATLTWPYYCGNLFPCHSAPADGLKLELALTGLAPGQVAVFPATIPAEAPSYMLAWAVGDYVEVELGQTSAGTTVSAWYRPEMEPDPTASLSHLVAAFDWFETTLGPYAFGTKVGGVAATWGPGALGGMEHHPFWHVASGIFTDESVHIHEAAHGWFGDGVRIRCWEDFVLSEGTVSYLEAVATEQVVGAAAGDAAWDGFARELDLAMAQSGPKVAWPEGCGEVDILEDGLFSPIPYMKGAFFLRAVEQRVGREALLGVLADFYAEQVGQAAGMADLLAAITASTGYDPTACAEQWLRQEPLPAVGECPAP